MSDPLAGFYLDKAVAVFGTHVDADVQKAQEGKKPGQAEAAANGAIARWLGSNNEAAKQRFKAPVATR